jgi:hypothetical protein
MSHLQHNNEVDIDFFIIITYLRGWCQLQGKTASVVQKYSKRLMIEIRTPSLSNDKHIDMDEPSVLNLHKCLFFHKEIWNHKWSISTSCYSYICRLSTDAVLPCNWHQPLRYVMMMKKSMSTSLLCCKWLIFVVIFYTNLASRLKPVLRDQPLQTLIFDFSRHWSDRTWLCSINNEELWHFEVV